MLPPFPVLFTTPFVPEARALFARFTTEPMFARKVLINNLIKSLIGAGVWAKLDALYVMAAADAQAAQRNWIADLYNLTAVSSPTFTADQGYAGNGSSSYLTTGFVPSTAGGRYALNSAHISVWSRTTGDLNLAEMGARDASNVNSTFLQFKTASGQPYQVNQGSGGITTAIADVAGQAVARRSDSATRGALKNGALVANQSVASTGLPGYQFYLLALNTAGTASLFSSRQLASASIGASLSDAETLSFYTALNTYMVAVGAA